MRHGCLRCGRVETHQLPWMNIHDAQKKRWKVDATTEIGWYEKRPLPQIDLCKSTKLSESHIPFRYVCVAH